MQQKCDFFSLRPNHMFLQSQTPAHPESRIALAVSQSQSFLLKNIQHECQFCTCQIMNSSNHKPQRVPRVGSSWILEVQSDFKLANHFLSRAKLLALRRLPSNGFIRSEDRVLVLVFRQPTGQIPYSGRLNYLVYIIIPITKYSFWKRIEIFQREMFNPNMSSNHTEL